LASCSVSSGKAVPVPVAQDSFCTADGINQYICENNTSLEDVLFKELVSDFPKNARKVAKEIGQTYEGHFCQTNSDNYIKLEDPQKPYVTGLGAPAKSKGLMSCLAMRVAGVLTKNSEHHVDLLKTEDFVKTIQSMSKECPFSVFVTHIQDLPVDHMHHFHGFCDEEQAPFKRATYIFTTEFEDSITDPSDFGEIVLKSFNPDGTRNVTAPALGARVFPGGLRGIVRLEDEPNPCARPNTE
jgi:hypothetical protein